MRSIGLKAWTAATGILLTLFLVVHLAGNLALFLPPDAARPAYNAYSAFLSGQLLIKVASLVTLLSFVAHAAVSGVLTLRNRRARGPVRYAYDRPQDTSPWYRRSMGWLGVILLVFLIEHMKTFWFAYKFGEVPSDVGGHRDLYGLVTAAFGNPLYAAAYTGAMIALAAHLVHGLASSAYTLGLGNRRWGRVVRGAGIALALIISVGFAAIPFWVYFTATAGAS